MNKKGYTLIELIAVIAIVGIVSIMMLPSLNNLLNDSGKTACNYYERVMIEAARAYITKEATDILENSALGGVGNFPSSYTLYLSDLKTNGYLDDYQDSIDSTMERTEIQNAYVVVTYDKNTKTYTYTPHLKCLKKSGDLIYSK